MLENNVLSRIRELCNNCNYSFYRLSKESDVPESTINSLFLNNNYPSIPTLYKLCDGLHITMSDFFLIEPAPGYITEESKLFLKKINLLNFKQKECLIIYINGLTN